MQERLRYLLTRYANQDATAAEETELMKIFLSANQDDQLKEIMMGMMESDHQILELDKERWEPVLMKVLNQPAENETGRLVEINQSGRRNRWSRTVAAAAILLLAGAGVYYYVIQEDAAENNLVNTEQPAAMPDISAPATNRAMITLADGKTVFLDSAINGQIALQGNIKLIKLANGQISYQLLASSNEGEVVYNTLSNPRGSEVIDMTLSDGSRVWLNAESSVTYPVAFVGNERNVTIAGEAYFEITHNANKPFFVTKGKTSVQVLGTHFNVNAYDDEENIKVTLLEGSVKVANGNANDLLKPGQQALISSTIKIVSDVNLDEVMAWKNGFFQFNRSSIPDVMRQVARWYDVDISYEGKIPNRQFGGKIHRNANISQVLTILEESNVHYRFEGRKITVFP